MIKRPGRHHVVPTDYKRQMKPKRAITMRVQIKPYPLAEHILCIPQRSYCTIFCILIKTCVTILRLSLVHSVDSNSNKEELSCHLHYSDNFPSTALSVAEQMYYLIILQFRGKCYVMLKKPASEQPQRSNNSSTFNKKSKWKFTNLFHFTIIKFSHKAERKSLFSILNISTYPIVTP